MTVRNPAPSPRFTLLRGIWKPLTLAAAPVALAAAQFVPHAHADAPLDATSVHTQITPLVTKYCLPCHNNDVKSGDVNFARATSALQIQKTPQNWKNGARRVREKSMPPQGSPMPSPSVRDQLADGIETILKLTPPSLLPKNPGRVLLHRLNRDEYNNTVQDLWGVTSRPADQFPADSGGGGGFDNNADTLYIPPILMERYLEASAQIVREAKPDRLFPVRPSATVKPRAAAQAILALQASRAYRRPATTDEIAPLVSLYDRATAQGKSWDEAVRLALRGVLVSPAFLFRIEADNAKPGPYHLSNYELASRLSYFLWSSCPDAPLLQAAKSNTLAQPAVLEAQVARMLKDPRARRFADGFAGQWLRVRELYTTAHPDPGKFPNYTPALRDAMYEEPILLFQSVVRENRPVFTLLDAPYTFVNEDLAKHYGINDIRGKQMRRVPVTDGKRGGVLTMASVLVLSSYPQRTSPVLRGKWILSDLLGTPPPPPPPVVATLSADDGVSKEGLTFRQRLEKHRSNPTCAGCHSRLDPLGFALENYDPIGKWRDKIGDLNVDAKGDMPDGTTFTGPVEFKKFLTTRRKDEFVHHLTGKMLSYALGRGLEDYDARAVSDISDRLAQDNFRMDRLIVEVVKSYPFQYRENRPVAPATPTKVATR